MKIKERLRDLTNSGKVLYEQFNIYITAIKFIYGFIELIKIVASIVI